MADTSLWEKKISLLLDVNLLFLWAQILKHFIFLFVLFWGGFHNVESSCIQTWAASAPVSLQCLVWKQVSSASVGTPSFLEVLAVE